jgi:hypothetical protein
VIRMLSRLIHSASPDVSMDVAAWAGKSGYQLKPLHPPVTDEVRPYIGDVRSQVDMRVNAAAFRKWIFDCFMSIKTSVAALSPTWMPNRFLW